MKTKYLLIAGLVIGFSSCSTAYRMGQTPDDVYYSPAPPQQEYVTTNNQQEKDSYGYNNQTDGENFAIRRITNPVYRNYNSLDFGYGYNPYAYNSSLYSPYSYINPYGYTGVTFYPYNYYSSYNSFNNYGNYYSPYDFYAPVYYNLKPGNAASSYSGPRRYSLGAYDRATNTNSGYVAPGTSSNNSVPVRTVAPTAPTNTTGVGSFIRRIFTPNNSNNSSERNTYINNNRNTENNTNDRPARSFQQSSAGSNNSSSSPSGSSSAPVRTFRK